MPLLPHKAAMIIRPTTTHFVRETCYLIVMRAISCTCAPSVLSLLPGCCCCLGTFLVVIAIGGTREIAGKLTALFCANDFASAAAFLKKPPTKSAHMSHWPRPIPLPNIYGMGGDCARTYVQHNTKAKGKDNLAKIRRGVLEGFPQTNHTYD